LFRENILYIMKFDVLTIFPQIFDSYFNTSIIKRGVKNKLIKIRIYNLRDFSKDKHKTVDDRPYGGGLGMILKFEPIYRALKKIKRSKKSRVILFTPQGRLFNQKKAQQLSKFDQIIMICGRYEGVDARVEKIIDEKISVGNYILTGGEIPAMILVDAVSRLIPGVLGKSKSFERDTFFKEGYKKYPQYTRPEKVIIRLGNKKRILRVPPVLLSGNHQKIRYWQKNHSKY